MKKAKPKYLEQGKEYKVYITEEKVKWINYLVMVFFFSLMGSIPLSLSFTVLIKTIEHTTTSQISFLLKNLFVIFFIILFIIGLIIYSDEAIEEETKVYKMKFEEVMEDEKHHDS